MSRGQRHSRPLRSLAYRSVVTTDAEGRRRGDAETGSPSPRLRVSALPFPSVVPLLFAIQFLTVLPVPVPSRANATEFSRSVAYFPLVGGLLGVLLVGGDVLLQAVFVPPVAHALLLALLVAITGALHLDGVADTCDGLLAPGRSPSERLAIMRDTHIGAFGMLGLVVILLTKWAALGALPAEGRAAALMSAPAIGRWAIVYAYAAHRYARPEPSPSAALKLGATGGAMAISTASAALVCLSLGVSGLALFVAVAVVTIALTRSIASRLGGVTGDTCGAACEVSETLALLLAPIAIRALS